MKTISWCLLSFLSFFCCGPASPQSDNKSFDAKAKNFFLNNYQLFDLTPLSKKDRCILEQTIINDLSALNNWRMVLFYDSLILKTYSDPYLQLPFTFIEDRANDKFHFIWIPFLKDYIFNVDAHYEAKNDSLYVLKEPVDAIKVPAQLVDNFFNTHNFVIKSEESFYKKLAMARHLMGEVLPSIFSNEISDFETRMGNMLKRKEISKMNYDLIKEKLIDPVTTEEYHRVQTFYLSEIGYVLLIYSVDKPTSQFKVDIYYIPEKERPWLARGISSNYRDCFKE